MAALAFVEAPVCPAQTQSQEAQTKLTTAATASRVLLIEAAILEPICLWPDRMKTLRNYTPAAPEQAPPAPELPVSSPAQPLP